MNTLEYVNHRISDGSGDWLSDVKWEDSRIREPIGFFSNMFADIFNSNPEILHSDGSNIVASGKDEMVTIQYQKDIESPDFLLMYYLHHDGTLLFTKNMIWERIFSRLINAQSIGKRNMEELFSETDFDYNGNLKQESYASYNVKYLVSDFLWDVQTVKHVDEEHGKMFPGVKDSIAMAVRVEMTLKDIAP